jgi:hypothetical protein
MIKFEDIEVYGLRTAAKGMRNPLNSWAKSDSYYNEGGFYVLGKNDLDLMQRLYRSGEEHRKFMRQIFISVTITAPMYFWKQFATYCVGVTVNSCSTMHTIHTREITLDDFSYEDMDEDAVVALQAIIELLNTYREIYNTTKDKKYWFSLIKLLPESYNQKRTVTLNYEVATNIIHQRMGHKLNEWHELIKMFVCLPYMKDITGFELDENK